MDKNEYHIYDLNHNEFIVKYISGTFECKKVKNNELVDPTKEELEFVISELKRIAKNKEENDIDKLLDQIIYLINNSEITSLEELQKHISGLNISAEEKQALFEKSYGLLNNRKNDKSEIVTLREELLKIIRNDNEGKTPSVITFEVRSNVSGYPLCNINVEKLDNNIARQVKNVTEYYTDELKHELIEPVLQELVLKSKIASQNVTQSDASFGYRSNLHMATLDNNIVRLNNIEQDYAYTLQKEILSLNEMPVISNPSERDAKIAEIQNGKKQEKSLEQEQVLKRELKKDENPNGFTANALLFAIICAITSMIILLQVIILK